MNIDPSLRNLDDLFPSDFSEERKAQAKTLFLKTLSEKAHELYGGKMQTLPKCGIYGLNWLNLWYTPGVSQVSTSIRDDNSRSFALSNRSNLVAVVSDSTRVLGDGDCTPPGGLGVMEGKALLMKYLGGIDATALCINSRGEDGKSDPRRIIDFVKMAEPSFGAVNLEDISQPNCYQVLDELRETLNIPVWHDDAQGTACVTLAALLNALKLAGKTLANAKIVFLGAGAASSAIAHLIIEDGGDPGKITIFDSQGSLHKNREDIKRDPRNYRKWELCRLTNPQGVLTIPQAIAGADALIALSSPGPDRIPREWISSMADGAIVFACANPVPEIWPYAAKEAGAFIVATGRGDFPNQVNNSICFPGILKGALLSGARKITDRMAIRCAHSIAEFSESRGINPDNIIATMEETEIFAREAADTADEAQKEGITRLKVSPGEVYSRAMGDIQSSRAAIQDLMDRGHITAPPEALLQEALDFALKETPER